MNGRNLVTIALVVGLILAAISSVGLGMAEETLPPLVEQVLPEVVGDQAALVGSIPVQGKLADASGNPIDGQRQVTFRLYNVETEATTAADCKDGPRAVTFANGLFSDKIIGCPSSLFNGQQLWLGIQVGADAEMTPRQAIYPVPYAMSVAPGARVIGNQTDWNGLYVQNTASTGVSYGVRGISQSPNGRGISGEGVSGAVGVWAQNNGSGAGQAALRAHNSNTTHGMAAYMSNNSDYGTAHFENDGTGEVLFLKSHGGPIIRGFNDNPASQQVFTVQGSGDIGQARAADGLVKAAFVGDCGVSTAIVRWFNNVNGTAPTNTSVVGGTCTIDFGFKVDDRFWAVTVPEPAGDRSTNCTPGANENRLYCARWTSSTGNSNPGRIMILIY